MKSWILKFSIALSLASSSSRINASRTIKRVDIEIPPACVQRLTLVDCEAANPKKCKSVFVRYFPASCGIIHLD